LYTYLINEIQMLTFFLIALVSVIPVVVNKKNARSSMQS